MFSCESFYDYEEKEALYKKLEIVKTEEIPQVGATIASYLSVKEAISTIRVCESGLFEGRDGHNHDRDNLDGNVPNKCPKISSL